MFGEQYKDIYMIIGKNGTQCDSYVQAIAVF